MKTYDVTLLSTLSLDFSGRDYLKTVPSTKLPWLQQITPVIGSIGKT